MRRSLRVAVASLSLMLVASVPAAAAASAASDSSIVTAADGSTVATGTLEVAHSDDFTTGRSKVWYSLHTSKGSIRLTFTGPGPVNEGGATVAVTGWQSGNTLTIAPGSPTRNVRVLRKAVPLVGSARTGPTTAADGAATAIGTGTGTDSGTPAADLLTAAPATVKVALVLVDFSNDARQTVTPAAASSIMFTNGDSVANFFAEESRGTIAVSGSVFGWYTLPETNAGCDWQQWRIDAMADANAAGANLASYDHVVFAWPFASSCGWAGLGYMPGAYTFNNGSFSLRVLAHELSHNFGINHASSLTCTSGATVVALSSTCSYSEYGDPFTVMGSGATYHNDGEQLGELGWLLPGEIETVTPDGGTYRLTPVLGSTPGSVKVLRIARGGGTSFYVDVWTPDGPYFDDFAPGSAAVSGVMVRLSADDGSPTWSPQNTKLVDTTPGTASFADAALTVGRILIDPVSHISIATVSLDASGASVRISESEAPSAPGSFSATAAGPTAVDLAWTAATDNVAVSGYRILRDGAQIATPGASARSYSDTGLTPETAYRFSIVALDASGNIGAAATSGATTPPDDHVPPTAPATIGAIATSSTTVALNWAPGTDDQGIADYRISRNGGLVATVAGTRWTDTHRAPRTTYTYDVVTVDLAGNASPPASAAATTPADTTKPTAPRSLHARRYSATRTRLSWLAASDNVGVVRYVVYRVGRVRPLTSTHGMSIRIARVPGARYYVRAIDASGNKSNRSAIVKAT
jgi:chitodextrinase